MEAHRLAAWRDEFIASGAEGLKERPASPEDRRLREAERKIGELTMDNDILRAAARRRGLDPAQEAEEVSAEVGAPISRVCLVLEASRSTVYARRGAGGKDGPAAKRGPKTPLSDEELTEAIRQVIASPPFSGEGHRKVTARLSREKVIHVGRKRVLRLMRQASLLAPQRTRGRRKPRPHDGTIIPGAPNLLWGTDATMAYTRRDGWVWAFAAVDHFTPEAWASVAKRGDRFAACEPIYAAVRDRFGSLGPDVARGSPAATTGDPSARALNRPGFAGGSRPWKGWSHADRQVPLQQAVPARDP